MPSKAQSEARARISQLEADPKHHRDADPGRADRESADDDINDQTHNQGHKDDPNVPGWTKDPSGHWVDPQA